LSQSEVKLYVVSTCSNEFLHNKVLCNTVSMHNSLFKDIDNVFIINGQLLKIKKKETIDDNLYCLIEDPFNDMVLQNLVSSGSGDMEKMIEMTLKYFDWQIISNLDDITDDRLKTFLTEEVQDVQV